MDAFVSGMRRKLENTTEIPVSIINNGFRCYFTLFHQIEQLFIGNNSPDWLVMVVYYASTFFQAIPVAVLALALPLPVQLTAVAALISLRHIDHDLLNDRLGRYSLQMLGHGHMAASAIRISQFVTLYSPWLLGATLVHTSLGSVFLMLSDKLRS